MKTKLRITSRDMGSMLGVFAHLRGGQDAGRHHCEGLRQEEWPGRGWAGSEQQPEAGGCCALGCLRAAGVLDLRALFSFAVACEAS